MSGFERSHGLSRLVVARLSDTRNHADGANASERRRDHAADGTFAEGNRAAKGTGARRAIRALVPAKGRRIYDLMLAELGAPTGTVAALHAADACRHHLDAGDLSELARGAGLATKEGAELHARAQRSSELAIRSMTAALEVSRLLRHPRTKAKTNATPPGFEPA